MPQDTKETVTRQLAAVLFASLARRDQRSKGEQYLRGLLQAQGRKSIRNIAANVGGPTVEQGLHHFISSSTWDWMPVRQALAHYLAHVEAARAWVVQPISIPKAGEHSVGVHRGLDPRLGSFRGQRAFGVWHATGELNVPVNWRLYLPGSWVRDDTRRRRADIPDTADEQTLEDCAAAAFLTTASSWGLPPRPVVLNTDVRRVQHTLGQFTDAGVPVIARISGASQLAVDDPELSARVGGVLEALEILDSAKKLRRPVEWTEKTGQLDVRRSSLAVAVRVGCTDPGNSRTPSADGARHLVLLGEWRHPQHCPGALWVTNMTSVPASALLRLTKLGCRVERESAAAGKSAGLKDYEGRTFRGWHRHITLASAAHAVTTLTDMADTADNRTSRSA
ncbi:IS701 family transposase [Streptomyces mutabilis]|uniref:IS701 family transposase n=1 Tax=Streptomyces mutabilis TaxID=67332 RepID=UPI00177DD20F|nr:transposase [Streptomyces mutabilis]GGQ45867.1 putative ISXo8 transposase [Streptomyces mutabilis]